MKKEKNEKKIFNSLLKLLLSNINMIETNFWKKYVMVEVWEKYFSMIYGMMKVNEDGLSVEVLI